MELASKIHHKRGGRSKEFAYPVKKSGWVNKYRGSGESGTRNTETGFYCHHNGRLAPPTLAYRLRHGGLLGNTKQSPSFAFESKCNFGMATYQ